ncbi:MAG: hypothetical protein M3436_13220 [Pseudomonadota bacterium]|nr:hypothetical protein [Pseudomonadota bacterium]
MREIERKLLVSTKDREPPHDVCRPYLGEDCTPILDITDSHEWHATLWYTPKAAVTPGRNIHLVVAVKTETSGGRLEWVNSLVVHAGDAPLPRFGKSWLYGDLHYHSQMTDNEGESGYSYRNVIRALGAMGMDFVFATDHASNSEQVDGGLVIYRCGREEGPRCPFTQRNKKCDDAGNKCLAFSMKEARDLNRIRFGAAKDILYGPSGVNASIAGEANTNGLARYRAEGILPQIYMGEEVDSWPELSVAEKEAGAVKYGNGLGYFFVDAEFQSYTNDGQPTYLAFDPQGIPVAEEVKNWVGENLPGLLGSEAVQDAVAFFAPDGMKMEPSRQHLVYFPKSNDTSSDGFIGSDSRVFGGASKPIGDVVAEVEGGGYAFLAHPLTSSGPSGAGPDIVPYSEVSLGRAWKSEAILGLQIWNEDDEEFARPQGGGCDALDDSNGRYLYRLPFRQTKFPWTWLGGGGKGTVVVPRQLAHGAFTWDRFLRKGLKPEETAPLTWLHKGLPRKWFMGGGSDSHGDLNYRRQGVPSLDRWCDSPVTDTAIGRPRNLVLVSTPPTGGRYSNRQVIDALRGGQFSVTNGPALRIGIDKNGNGKMDDVDLQMGATFEMFPGEHVPLLVEWKSTPEFGPIEEIDVYVGNALVTFAVDKHGPTHLTLAHDPAAYQPDPSGVLRIKPSGGLAMAGVANLYLSPSQFGLVAEGNPLFYVRAYARTILAPFGGVNSATGYVEPCPAGARCKVGHAFANPIWGRYHATCPQTGPAQTQDSGTVGVGGIGSKAGGGAHVKPTVLDQASLRTSSRDQDGNAVPDTCERDIPDPCPAAGTPIGSHADIDLVFTQEGASTTPPAKSPPPRSCQILAGAAQPVGSKAAGGAAVDASSSPKKTIPAETLPELQPAPRRQQLEPEDLPVKGKGRRAR